MTKKFYATGSVNALTPCPAAFPPWVGRHEYEGSLREEDFMPDQIAPEYREADRRSGPNQENTERARAGVTGHNVRTRLRSHLFRATPSIRLTSLRTPIQETF